jgi:hypothetical protein
LISVVTEDSQLIENTGRFTIECSQEDRFLKDNSPVIGYLERQSLGFYEYYNPSNGTLYIQLHNQNKPCAKIFVKKGNNSRASPSAYDYKTDH